MEHTTLSCGIITKRCVKPKYSLKLYRFNSSNYDTWEVNDNSATKSQNFNSNELGSPTKKVNGISVA